MSLNMIRASARAFSTASRLHSDKLYELRIYSFKISNLAEFKKTAKEALPVRYSHSPGLGYFYSEIGGIAETVHIWEYDSYSQRAKVRQDLAGDSSWISLASPMLKVLDKQENMSMRLYPWSKVQQDISPGGVYHLYTFTFLPDVTGNMMSQQLENFIREAGLSAVGVWREELGKHVNRNAHALFHCDDSESGQNPALASTEAWDKINRYTSQIHGRLLTPAEWSNYK